MTWRRVFFRRRQEKITTGKREKGKKGKRENEMRRRLHTNMRPAATRTKKPTKTTILTHKTNNLRRGSSTTRDDGGGYDDAADSARPVHWGVAFVVMVVWVWRHTLVYPVAAALYPAVGFVTNLCYRVLVAPLMYGLAWIIRLAWGDVCVPLLRTLFNISEPQVEEFFVWFCIIYNVYFFVALARSLYVHVSAALAWTSPYLYRWAVATKRRC